MLNGMMWNRYLECRTDLVVQCGCL